MPTRTCLTCPDSLRRYAVYCDDCLRYLTHSRGGGHSTHVDPGIAVLVQICSRLGVDVEATLVTLFRRKFARNRKQNATILRTLRKADAAGEATDYLAYMADPNHKSWRYEAARATREWKWARVLEDSNDQEVEEGRLPVPAWSKEIKRLRARARARAASIKQKAHKTPKEEVRGRVAFLLQAFGKLPGQKTS